MPAVVYEKKGGIAYIILNRPEVHNALDAEVVVRLAEAWQDFADDDSLRVAISISSTRLPSSSPAITTATPVWR